jgi:cysteine desulfurase
MTVYLDNAATTAVCPEAAQAALEIMTVNYGNPSSTHTMGRNADKALKAARAQIANALGAAPEEIFFTSCGSESDNWAILSGAELMRRKGKHIISSEAEHAAVLKSLDILEKHGYEVTRLKPERDGSISVASVEQALRDDTILVSLMLVNNETGGITDIAGIAKMLKARKNPAVLHTDAVQGFLKIPFSAKSLGADMISLSGHKIHAPKGIGALYVRGGTKLNLSPLIVGGGQESGRRSGTEPLPQIVAFGVAAELGKAKMADSAAEMARLKKLAIKRLTAENEGLTVMSGAAPHILNISMPGYRSEVLMNYLEAKNVFVSKSSACKKGGRSYVLEACGRSSVEIDGALRISLSRYTTETDINVLCDVLSQAKRQLKTVLR